MTGIFSEIRGWDSKDSLKYFNAICLSEKDSMMGTFNDATDFVWLGSWKANRVLFLELNSFSTLFEGIG